MSKVSKKFDKVFEYLKKSCCDSRIEQFSLVSLFCILFLLLIGISAIFSAQNCYGGSQWKLQICWSVLGLITYFITSLLDYQLLSKYAHVVYFISILLLCCIFTPLGERRFGALRWVNLFGFTIQPSEVGKVGFLIMISAMLSRYELAKKQTITKTIIKNIVIIFSIPLFLVFMQPDLGSALIFPTVLFSILFAAKLAHRFFVFLLSLGVIFLGIITFDIYEYAEFMSENNYNSITDCGLYEKHSFIPLKDYQRNRILAFVAPEIIDPNGVGVSWNLRQSLISIGTGGLLGKGFNNGTQAKLGYLPKSVASNDFIFSVITEERGLIGGLFVLILYAILIVNGLRVALAARDRFGTYMAVGISIMFLMHICINIGMTLGLMPITGIPLPFLSYGGSFLLICCFLQGVLQSIHRFQKCYD